MSEVLQRIVDARIAEHAAVVERACEMAIELGVGVVVVDDDGITRAKPLRQVPAGTIANFPSYSAYQRWMKIGYPL
jgi:hypothetical protein